MIIGIDIDDTITNSSDVFVEYAKEYNLSIGHSYKMNINELDQYVAFGWDKKMQNEFANRYLENIFRFANSQYKAVEIINNLHYMGHKIILISSRINDESNGVLEITEQWLKKQGILYDRLILDCSNKVKECAENCIDVFIDDNFSNCVAVRTTHKIPVFIFNTRYNKKYTHSHIKRVSSWEDFYKQLLMLNKNETLAEELEYIDVKDRQDFPEEPKGFRFVYFYIENGYFRGYIAPEDLSRADFMEKYPQYVPEHNKPIYENDGIILRADPKFPCPGFYILSLSRTYRAFDYLDDITFLRFSFILKKTKEAMRYVLDINYAHLLSNEKSDPFVNVHFWLVPVNGTSSPDLLDFNVKDYLESFKPGNEVIKIKEYNRKIKDYFDDIKLTEMDDALKRRLCSTKEQIICT